MIQSLQTFVCLVSRRLVEKQLAVIHFTDKQLTKERLFRILLKRWACSSADCDVRKELLSRIN
jgi:hypothetical protein